MEGQYDALCAEQGKVNRLDVVEKTMCSTGYEELSDEDLQRLMAASPHLKGKTLEELQDMRYKYEAMRRAPRADKEKVTQRLEEVKLHETWARRSKGGQEFLQASHNAKPPAAP
jgi:hypothetical protein